MRIVILSECFTKAMGYIENKLPKALARLGHDVHVVTSDLQVYFQIPEYKSTYERFQGPAIQPCGVEVLDGISLHRLPHQLPCGYVRIVGLWRYLKKLQPDIVQAHAAASWLPLEAALAQPYCGYRLFTGAHQTASVFSPAVKKSMRFSLRRLGSDIRRALPGRLVSLRAEKCYAATPDCRDIAVKYYGVPASQIELCSLGVDTDLFFPVGDSADFRASREATRRHFGFGPDDIVCIYTGRMTSDKNPLCLAMAVEQLRMQGQPFRALFIGSGPQAEQIQGCNGSVRQDFVPNWELSPLYRAADIGVWPAGESLSMLDAAACGIPIVVNDTVLAVERFEGNGLTYHQGDVSSLAATLLRLRNAELRKSLGEFGAAKIVRDFSWTTIAQRRLRDYEEALAGRDKKCLQGAVPTKDTGGARPETGSH
jgi:glycosyltransferase involved in cell wall biosynthesis